jgi:hypothetical protein
MEFGEGLFDDLAEMAAFAGVDHDLAEFGHWGEFSKYARVSSSTVGEAAEGGCPHLTHAGTIRLCLRHRISL